jgi:hypothetical protein
MIAPRTIAVALFILNDNSVFADHIPFVNIGSSARCCITLSDGMKLTVKKAVVNEKLI